MQMICCIMNTDSLPFTYQNNESEREMTYHTADLQRFALKYSLTLKEAMTLPALFGKVAKEFNMATRQLISDATYNKELGDYLASVSRTVAAKI